MSSAIHKISNPRFKEAISTLWDRGAFIIPTGGDTGKKPLVRMFKNRHPLQLVFEKLKDAESLTYGIRLPHLAVIDIDDPSETLLTEIIDRCGDSPFKVATGRGKHLYYACNEKPTFNFRGSGMPVDIKYGLNAYVIGPHSTRPDGVHYRFEGANLSLNKLPTLNLPRCSRSVGRATLINEGSRNSFLYKQAINYVRTVENENELYENLIYDRDEYCENPQSISDKEVSKIAKWAWLKRLDNKIFEGQHSVFKVDRHAHTTINAHPKGRDAWELYVFLNDKHGHQIGKRFVIDVEAIQQAYKFHFGQRATYTAINTLLELGYLKLVKNYSVQKTKRLFQLSVPV